MVTKYQERFSDLILKVGKLVTFSFKKKAGIKLMRRKSVKARHTFINYVR